MVVGLDVLVNDLGIAHTLLANGYIANISMESVDEGNKAVLVF